MNGKEVYSVIETLASNQGFYGRLLSRLNEAPEEMVNEFLESFEECKDVVDVIMAIEG